ncbi:hypothetical protein [Thiohalomonas denitrificans]|uniref:hypothetical protein n=1 Tax=Thiohalomonas denitrificans TaxID=415747 RepID=UPI0026EB3150|nr:hypothetical protein [Thiohalomonas denitrificans]
MWKKVQNYNLTWHHQERRGAIHLKLEDGSEGILNHLSSQDLGAFTALLRDEPLIWYHTIRGDITTHSAPQDEEERD